MNTTKRDYTHLYGQRFGKWQVLEADRTLPAQGGKYKRLKLKCLCECGTIALVDYFNLKRGQTTKCQHCRIHNQAAFNATLSGYKKRAKKKNLDWNLSEEEFKNLCLGKCHYCNREPDHIRTVRECYGSFISNGIDRVDNSKGYVFENCVSCCQFCNQMKMDFTKEEFLEQIKKIYSFSVDK